MDLGARVCSAFHDLPQSRFLGMEILDVGLESGRSSMLLPFSADLASRDGTIDWVATATLIDTAASLAVCAAIEGRSAFATIDLALQRIAPPLYQLPLVATAIVLAQENQVATVAVELYQCGEASLLGTARAGFWISDSPMSSDGPTQDQILAIGEAARDVGNTELASIGLDISGFERRLNLGVFHRKASRSIRLPFQPRVTFNPVTGAIHGGFIAALLEYTAIDHHRLGLISRWAPASALSVDFLRPARAGDLWAEVTIDEESPTGRMITVEAWQDDRLRPIASAIATFDTDVRHLKC
jgi:acyl-coenzyme A thioesterase PaaI-like protein